MGLLSKLFGSNQKPVETEEDRISKLFLDVIGETPESLKNKLLFTEPSDSVQDIGNAMVAGFRDYDIFSIHNNLTFDSPITKDTVKIYLNMLAPVIRKPTFFNDDLFNIYSKRLEDSLNIIEDRFRTNASDLQLEVIKKIIGWYMDEIQTWNFYKSSNPSETESKSAKNYKEMLLIKDTANRSNFRVHEVYTRLERAFGTIEETLKQRALPSYAIDYRHYGQSNRY